MASKRGKIQMSDEEMRDFIETRKSMQVCTLNQDGSPHLTTLWFAMIDGKAVFETFTKSQKIRNLQRDPRIAVLWEDGVEYAELRGVSINGRAELVSDPGKVHALARPVMGRNNPGLTEQQLDDLVKMMAAKRTAVVVHPEKIMSWDHSKLGGGY